MTKEVKYHNLGIRLLYLLAVLITVLCLFANQSFAEEQATESSSEESDLWAIQAPETTKSASMGKKKAATLNARARLKPPSPVEKNKISGQKIAKIFWIAPEKPAESFILSFGSDAANLKNQLHIPAKKLTLLKDPVHGDILGYAFPLDTNATKIFYRLQAERDGSFSKKSPVTELILQSR